MRRLTCCLPNSPSSSSHWCAPVTEPVSVGAVHPCQSSSSGLCSLPGAEQASRTHVHSFTVSFSMVVNLSLLCFLVWEEKSCLTLSLGAFTSTWPGNFHFSCDGDQTHITKIGTELQTARVGSATESRLMKEYRNVNLGYLFLLDFITEGGGRQGKASRDIRLGSSCLLHTNRDFLKTDIRFCQRRKWSLRRMTVSQGTTKVRP